MLVEAHAAKRRPRILAVEDTPCTRRLLSLVLEDGDHAIDCVETGEAALEALTRCRYDLVLMDLRLPGLGGRETVARIREAEAVGERLPVLALSADVHPGAAQEAQEAGFDAFLPKPFSPPGPPRRRQRAPGAHAAAHACVARRLRPP